MPSVFARPNKFNLSHTNILTCEMGALVPFLTQEVLPGDEFRIRTDAMVRLAPMLAPIFGEVDFYTHYFYVPTRTIWSGFEEFITNGLELGTTEVVPPYVTGPSAETSATVSAGPGSLLDYLDYPCGDNAGANNSSVCSVVNGGRYSALPIRVYNKIVNDWYRNEFLQQERKNPTKNGSTAWYEIANDVAKRCWPRDYVTSALPFTQLGDPVTIPVGITSAPVTLTATGTNNIWTGGAGTTEIDNVRLHGTGNGEGYLENQDTSSRINLKNITSLFTAEADLSQAYSTTINDLRTAFQLQRIMERKARSGNRYVEYLAASFGVRSPDARLQRAEFLGGGKSPIMISEVLQTSAGTQTSPQGNMAGHGFGASRSFSVNKAFTEHGYIMGILSIMPKPSYFQGRRRELARWSWTDYYQPEFAHLGEQAVYKSELVSNSSTVASGSFEYGDIFGYQPRYEEYRRKLSGVHGDFRRNMSYWHLARAFSDVPALNADFVACTPSKRIFAAGDQATRPCWVEMYLDIKAIRPLPKHGAPGFMDH